MRVNITTNVKRKNPLSILINHETLRRITENRLNFGTAPREGVFYGENYVSNDLEDRHEPTLYLQRDFDGSYLLERSVYYRGEE